MSTWQLQNKYVIHFIVITFFLCIGHVGSANILIENYVFQIARELRLRDIGGIIVVDFIDMADDCKLVSLPPVLEILG